MTWFSTAYMPNPNHAPDPVEIVGCFGSHIWAESLKHAESLAVARNIGERVLGRWRPVTQRDKPRSAMVRRGPYPLTSDMLRKRSLTAKQKLDAIHSATFLCYLLMQSCSAPPCDIVGDEGLLHQIIHSLRWGRPRRASLAETVAYFEARVPGYLKRNGGP